MLKKKTLIKHDGPVYREVIPQSLSFALKHPAFWILGFFAAILYSGGIFDTFTKLWGTVTNPTENLFILFLRMIGTGNITLTGHWTNIAWALILLFGIFVIAFTILGFACISEGALVHAIGNWKINKYRGLKHSLGVSAKSIRPIIVFNFFMVVFTLLVLGLLKNIVAFSMTATNPGLYLSLVITFVALSFILLLACVIHIYTLNAIILQGANLHEALIRSFALFKDHWLITVETAILQAIVQFVLSILLLIIAAILSFPALVLFILAILNQSFAFFQASLVLLLVLLLPFMLAATGYIVSFQYALWTLMYKKLGEGGIVPKLHRLFRTIAKNPAASDL